MIDRVILRKARAAAADFNHSLHSYFHVPSGTRHRPGSWNAKGYSGCCARSTRMLNQQYWCLRLRCLFCNLHFIYLLWQSWF